MRKKDEREYRDSCWNKAREDELVFVLLARDPAFAATLRFRAEERVRLGKNKADDRQIRDALAQAKLAEEQAKVIGPAVREGC